MNKLFILTDYKGIFGSKWNAVPYRSGMDLEIMRNEFLNAGFSVSIMTFAEAANNGTIQKGDFVIYTSTEDIGYYYKSFIEDVIYYLELIGVITIPSYSILRANNNKVFMELAVNHFIGSNDAHINAKVYGTKEEAVQNMKDLTFPQVIKSSQGAMSRGVRLARNPNQFLRAITNHNRTKSLYNEFKDFIRGYKYKGYQQESKHRKKFISQSFIPNLNNDYKILIFGDKYFIFSRPVRKNDFRASGSGNKNYTFGSACIYPKGIFNYAKSIYDKFDLPHLSLDIAFDGRRFYLIEWQGIYFGTVGVIKSDVFFLQQESSWIQIPSNQSLEKIYCESIASHINEMFNSKSL